MNFFKGDLEAPLPAPKPSAITCLHEDPELTVTPEKHAALSRKKEVRFKSPVFVSHRGADKNVHCFDTRGDARNEWGVSRSTNDDVPPADTAGHFAENYSGIPLLYNGDAARGRYNFPFTDPLGKENTAVAGELAVPELNATLRIQQELKELQLRKVDANAEVRNRLASSHMMRESLKAKVYSKVNVKEPIFDGVVSTNVAKEQLIAAAERNMVKAKGGMEHMKRPGGKDTAAVGSSQGVARDISPCLQRFWSRRSLCFLGSPAPEHFQYRLSCLDPPTATCSPVGLSTPDADATSSFLLDVYKHVRSWHV